MNKDTEYKNGYNHAICDAIEYLRNNLIYVPEDDNPHVEGCRIESLEEFLDNFKNKLIKYHNS